METIYLTYPTNYKKRTIEPSSLAVGFFDGVHKGHQQVIQTAIDHAKDKSLASAVMTFEPHPVSVLKDEPLKQYLLTSLAEKEQVFEQLGIDYLLVVTFDLNLAKLSPQDFVDLFFVDLNVKHVSAGFDYSFGHKGAGKIKDMDHYAKDRLTYTVVDKVTSEDEKISSTRIRELIQRGEPKLAGELLGRPFTLTGTVKQGFQRGREIGYPTANLAIDPSLAMPKVGIYAVKALVLGHEYEGMASIGFNPTFDDVHETPSVEVHLFNFDEDIYHESMQVAFMAYLRDEVAYESQEKLIDQLKLDEIDAKNSLKDQH